LSGESSLEPSIHKHVSLTYPPLTLLPGRVVAGKVVEHMKTAEVDGE